MRNSRGSIDRSSSGFSRTAGSSAQPHRNWATVASNFRRSSNLIAWASAGGRLNARAIASGSAKSLLHNCSSSRALLSNSVSSRLGLGLASESTLLSCLSAVQMPFTIGRGAMSRQRSAEANRLRRVNRLHIGYGSAGKCQERIERVADGAAQRAHQPVQGSFGKEDIPGSLQEKGPFPVTDQSRRGSLF